MNPGDPVQFTQRDDNLILDNGLVSVDVDLVDSTLDIRAAHGTPFRATGLSAEARIDGQWVRTHGHPVERWTREDVADSLGKGMRIEISCLADEGPVYVTLSIFLYQARRTIALVLKLKNQATVTSRVDELRPLVMDAVRGGFLHLGNGLESAKMYEESNNLYGAVVHDLARTPPTGAANPLADADAVATDGGISHQSGWLGLIYNPVSRTSFLGGFLTTQLALSKVCTQYKPDRGITGWYAACKCDGLALGPGEELAAERLCLDVRKPESQAFLARTFGQLRSLGIKYYKLDFLNGPSTVPLSFTDGIKNQDRVRDGERMRIGLSIIRNAVGDESYLLVGNAPNSHVLGIATAVRSALDIGNAYMGSEEGWQHFRRCSGMLAGRYFQQGKFWHGDADTICVGGNPPDFSTVPDLGEARIRTTAAVLSEGDTPDPHYPINRFPHNAGRSRAIRGKVGRRRADSQRPLPTRSGCPRRYLRLRACQVRCPGSQGRGCGARLTHRTRSLESQP